MKASASHSWVRMRRLSGSIGANPAITCRVGMTWAPKGDERRGYVSKHRSHTFILPTWRSVEKSVLLPDETDRDAQVFSS